SNPLFDDSTSSDDESSHEEDIHEMSFKTYPNPLFDLDEEIISSEFNPIYNEDLDCKPKNDRFDTKSYLLESLLNRDESIPLGIDCDDSDSEGDNLFLERLLHDDPTPLPDTLDFDFLNVVRVFLPFFTYLVTFSILLSSGSEDTIFNPGISNYHFSSLEPGCSHRCGTFKKFNTHRSHLNESPMEMLFSTYTPLINSSMGELGQAKRPKTSTSLLHLAGSQLMLKSSYKAEDGVIISIPPLIGGVADAVVEIKGTGCPPSDRSDFANEEFVDELAHIISLPEYDCFYFKDLPDPGELISIFNFGIRENPPSTTRVNLPVEDDYSPLLTYVKFDFKALSISITFRFSVGLQTPDDPSRSRLGFIKKMGVHG
nr:hypothetical protein [Tanacetum cinerariifolium]